MIDVEIYCTRIDQVPYKEVEIIISNYLYTGRGVQGGIALMGLHLFSLLLLNNKNLYRRRQFSSFLPRHVDERNSKHPRYRTEIKGQQSVVNILLSHAGS